MKTRDFSYDLPEKLITQQPEHQRSGSRLLYIDRQRGSAIHDSRFTDLPGFLRAGDLLVFNNTRVIPARLFGHKSTGGKVEILVERLIDDHTMLAHVRASKTPGSGTAIHLDTAANSTDSVTFEVNGRRHDLFVLSLRNDREETGTIAAILEKHGHMPLPPYIDRADDAQDFSRYQTVYAEAPGAVAASTAGLHFDEAILERLRAAGIDFAYVTLHVGAGTFQPVRCENILDHRMHSEYVIVPEETVLQCRQARARGGRIVAVGTTAVRSLETASAGGELESYRGETDIFIYPGYQFKSVDALLTNFHLPESTLLMLVCAFAGYDTTMAAYRHAVTQGYRFFSYGDAMLIQ
jgi:S-adenosylmethionine:tRNA ribosyltransferase-isomerase